MTNEFKEIDIALNKIANLKVSIECLKDISAYKKQIINAFDEISLAIDNVANKFDNQKED